MKRTEAVVVDSARTAHGKLLGSLADVSAVELGTVALEGLLDRVPVDEPSVDWVGMGNAISAGLGQVPARQAVVESRLPDTTPATTLNEASGSGLRAITTAVNRIEGGRAEVAVAGGMESMTNAPYLLRDLRRGRRHGDATLVDSMVRDALWDVSCDAHMGELTEDLAEEYGIGREEQDRYALSSHERALSSLEHGAFDAEIVPVEVEEDEVYRMEEGPRETSMEQLSKLRPAFREGGTITPGNASDLSDGAGCALVAHERRVESMTEGGDSVFDVADYAAVYRSPRWFGLAAGDVVERLLEDNDLSVDDVDLFEINEAFAATMVHVRDDLGIPMDSLNVRGGAIALGHPIGASGGMLTTTMTHTMEDDDLDVGLVAMSIGGGGGIGMLVERREV